MQIKNEPRNIWAIGRNYAEHAKELGNEVPKEPLIFLKAGSSAVFASELTLPAWSQEVHHEIELALCFDNQFKIQSAALALDLTERHFQNLLKAKGSPWTLAKSFTGACPLSDFFPVKSLDELSALDIRLFINGELRQSGSTSQMIFSLQQQIDYVRAHFPVCAGDLLLTGTPSGVGPIKRGDRLRGELVGKMTKEWTIL
jgi:2-keto-4-pentenoate hydratase/2-oxohepta-3-ene-1,7-dioic acid hydratase in catechol pathway